MAQARADPVRLGVAVMERMGTTWRDEACHVTAVEERHDGVARGAIGQDVNRSGRKGG